MENKHAIRNPEWPVTVIWLILVFGFLTGVAFGQTTVDTHGIQGAVPNLAVQARIIAVIGIVFAAVQAAKLAFPAIAGGWAILLNIVLSTAGIVVALPAEKVFSLETLSAVIVAAIGAAGVHGTVSAVRERARVKKLYDTGQLGRVGTIPSGTGPSSDPTKGRHP